MVGPEFSAAEGCGNLNDEAPGNFDSTLGMEAGMAFAFGESL